MRNIGSVTILFVSVLCGTVLSVRGQMTDIEGEWVNVNPNTRGVTRLVISKTKSGWGVDAWGRCHPQECVWSPAILNPVGSSVEDFSFNRGLAIWNAGIASRYVSIVLNRGRLITEIITIFSDRSGRANFRVVEEFNRAEASSSGRSLGKEISITYSN